MVDMNLTQTHRTFANGIQGIVAHAPGLTRAHVSIAIAVGYLDEPPALPGLAHLLEHVLTTVPLTESPESSLLAWFAKHQGSLNARTDDHVTDIHFTVPLEGLAKAAMKTASQLAAPHMPLPVIRSEVTAIDAEWQARQQSSAMHELAAIAALADPHHIGAECRHGNAQTLGGDAARLYEALAAFHHDHYRGSRVCIAIISPWGTERMIDLTQRMAALFKPPLEDNATLAIRPRWGHSRSAETPAATPGVTLCWPLPPNLSRHQFLNLAQFADSLNQGFLIEQLTEQLPASFSDYCATASPSGATDTFHLQFSGNLNKNQQEALAGMLYKHLNSQLSAKKSADCSTWQPPANTVQLAPAWFAYARQQALALRFPTASSVHSLPLDSTRFIVSPAASATKRPVASVRHPSTQNMQRWHGQYGVSDDFAALADTNWAACFLPNTKITLGPLAAKRLAQKGLVLQQMHLVQGSWLITMGNRAAPAMSALLSNATLTATPPANGLLAQQLLQRLLRLPDTPAMWVSHRAEADRVSQALALLANGPITEEIKTAPLDEATGKAANVSTAIMRTLSLPGASAQRWLLAAAEQRHSASFFQQARSEYQLGYVAAVRRGDGAPCSLGYVVQTGSNVDGVAATLNTIVARLWQTVDSSLPTLPAPPETPLAALITQWNCLLSGATNPLHRLPCEIPEPLDLISTHGHWQTHCLDSTGRYWISD